MKQFTLFDPATGNITGHLQVSDDMSESVLRVANPWFVAGHWPTDKYRIIHGEPQPVVCVKSAQDLRHERRQRLELVDRINPVWYGSLTDQQRTELADYRQALLDVPQQPGFPAQIEWPQPPHWLG